jgi:hypothetical protein
LSKWLFTPLALGALGWFAWSARQVLGDVLSEANIARLGLCVLVWSLGQALVPTFVHWTLRQLNVQVEWKTLLFSHLRRLPARYLPGGVWHTVGRAVDMGRVGIAPRQVVAVISLEQFGALLVTATAGGFITAFFTPQSSWQWLAVSGAVAGMLGFPVLHRLINRRVLKRAPGISVRGFCAGIAIVCVFWTIATCTFLLYLSALTLPGIPELLMSVSDTVRIAGVYLFSWAIGFVAVFAPQGIGVFELVAGDLLNLSTSLVELAVIIAGFRGVVLVADVVLWLAAQLLRRFAGP